MTMLYDLGNETILSIRNNPHGQGAGVVSPHYYQKTKISIIKNNNLKLKNNYRILS